MYQIPEILGQYLQFRKLVNLLLTRNSKLQPWKIITAASF